MNKNKLLLGFVITSLTMVGTVVFLSCTDESTTLFAKATDNTLWYHYVAVAATETKHGSREFWANCSTHNYSLSLPDSSNIQEGVAFDSTEYYNDLTSGDGRYIAPLSKTLCSETTKSIWDNYFDGLNYYYSGMNLTAHSLVYLPGNIDSPAQELVSEIDNGKIHVDSPSYTVDGYAEFTDLTDGVITCHEVTHHKASGTINDNGVKTNGASYRGENFFLFDFDYSDFAFDNDEKLYKADETSFLYTTPYGSMPITMNNVRVGFIDDELYAWSAEFDQGGQIYIYSCTYTDHGTTSVTIPVV